MTNRSLTITFIVLSASATSLVACLWDYDTLAMERRRFPDALELISGKFLRHSPEFYLWRVNDRLERLRTQPHELALYDDLAVAYDKLGKHDQAIATIKLKEPVESGSYETLANLGTFLIHSGRLSDGLAHIDRAIEINPNAHFGREIYQKLLVEYLLIKMSSAQQSQPLDFSQLDLPLDKRGDLGSESGFARFLIDRWQLEDPENAGQQQTQKLQQATRGILGMMRFGNHRSPVLLEVLGDVLHAGNRDANRLAARAYLKASYEVPSAEAEAVYREKARSTLRMQTQHEKTESTLSLAHLEQQFRRELATADAWFDQVRADELNWIASGGNVDELFSRKYYAEPRVSGGDPSPVLPQRWLLAIWGGVILIVINTAWWVTRWRSNRMDSSSQ